MSRATEKKADFRVLVGNTVFGLEFLRGFPQESLALIYAPFVTARKPLYRFTIEYGAADTRRAEDEGLSCVFQGSRYTLLSGFCHAALDEASRSARVVFYSGACTEAVISVLTNLMMAALLRKGALFFHGCAIADKTKAWLFVGPSGAGKSTVAGLSQHATVLSEELVGVLLAKQGARAFAMPYAGDQRFAQRSNRAYPVAGMYALVKDTRNLVRAVPRQQAMAEFLVLPAVVNEVQQLSLYLGRFARLMGAVQCYRLHFLPDTSFWRCIHGHEKQRAAAL